MVLTPPRERAGPLVASGPLAVLLAVLAGFVWLVGGLSVDHVVEATAADYALQSAMARGDTAAIAEQGRRRLDLPVRAPGVRLRMVVALALIDAGRAREGMLVAEGVLDEVVRSAGADSAAAAEMRNGLAWGLVTLPERSDADLAHAFDLVNRALAHDPDSPFFLGTRATIQLRRGELAEAREGLTRALALHTVDDARATDRVILAIVLARLGERDAAREALARGRGEGRAEQDFVDEAERLLAE